MKGKKDKETKVNVVNSSLDHTLTVAVYHPDTNPDEITVHITGIYYTPPNPPTKYGQMEPDISEKLFPLGKRLFYVKGTYPGDRYKVR